MDWSQVLFLFFANVGMIVWFRAESRNDWRHMDNKLDKCLEGIRAEMKDFHDRLISLQEKSKESKGK